MTVTINEATLYIDSACVFIGCAGLVFAVWAHGRLDVARRFLSAAEDRLAWAKEEHQLTAHMLYRYVAGQPNCPVPEGDATK